MMIQTVVGKVIVKVTLYDRGSGVKDVERVESADHSNHFVLSNLKNIKRYECILAENVFSFFCCSVFFGAPDGIHKVGLSSTVRPNDCGEVLERANDLSPCIRFEVFRLNPHETPHILLSDAGALLPNDSK